MSNNIETIDYATFVARLKKDPEAIQAELTPEKADLIHMVMGIVGEAGELLDAIKKHVIYGNPLDRTNVVEELGDLEFYMEGLRQTLNIGLVEVFKHNKEKLGTRYTSLTYSDAAAIAREDKND